MRGAPTHLYAHTVTALRQKRSPDGLYNASIPSQMRAKIDEHSDHLKHFGSIHFRSLWPPIVPRSWLLTAILQPSMHANFLSACSRHLPYIARTPSRAAPLSKLSKRALTLSTSRILVEINFQHLSTSPLSSFRSISPISGSITSSISSGSSASITLPVARAFICVWTHGEVRVR
jgi:hypothetical protein